MNTRAAKNSRAAAPGLRTEVSAAPRPDASGPAGLKQPVVGAAQLLQLQRTIGNQSLLKWLGGEQSAPLQRFVDPAVTGPLVGAVTRGQIYNIYGSHVWEEYLRVSELIKERPDLKTKATSLRRAWEAFIDETTTTDGHPDSPLLNHAQAIGALNSLIQQINAAEQSVYDTPLSSVNEDMKIGTEFTFTNPDIARLKIGKDDSIMEKANDYIKRWTSGGIEIPPQGKTKSPKARAFKYQLKELQREWWWVLDIDDGCIETQTAPTSLKDLKGSKEIQHIIDNDIFNAAKKLKLEPDAEIGGGHLSLDRASTFGESSVAFRNFIVLYTNNADHWRKLDADFINAPLVQELPKELRAEFVRVIHEFDQAYNGPIHQKWSIDRLVNELMNRVFTFVRTVEQVGNAPHYQATNLEHMQDKDVSARRIEMRRFPAQKGINDLLYVHLQELQQLIIESRDKRLIPLNEIDTETNLNADKIAAGTEVDVETIIRAQQKLDQNKKLSQKEEREYNKRSLLESP
ncbi:hypothetical protein [Paenibacillus hamazuiensis]|uniref:hypothetical protein n=1 Tax=Paenibacillus hamazuiensis TaxID=2936508 RepID=UPI00200CA606|nr:hypothetical protein [Paenibacillus hamazuiensis]